MPRLVCISDTHGCHDFELPPGDVLVHAGDLTGRGSLRAVEREADWLPSLPYAHKVVISGNHDFAFERDPAAARAAMHGLDYLQDSGVARLGLRFWGSPWQPRFHDWAFNLDRGAPLRERWATIPVGLDVLVVHGPPAGFGDRTQRGSRVGCEDLRAAIVRAAPRLVVFGHIHEDPGRWELGTSTLVNARPATCRTAPRTLRSSSTWSPPRRTVESRGGTAPNP